MSTRILAHMNQIWLPGQTYVAEGPHDQTGMYVMHHAFRRDLDRFVAAVRFTPVDEVEVWTALRKRWARFEAVLHHHHAVEDAAIWPVMLRHADEAGNRDDRETLEAMEAEHAMIDPSLAAARHGYARMVDCPCDEHRDKLLAAAVDLRDVLAEHLRHEETEALPLLQRTVSTEEFAAMESAAARAYPATMFPFLVPWVLDRLPPAGRDAMVRSAGRGYLALWYLVRGRYARAEAATFRHAPAAGWATAG